jgi:hypothetical protein
VGRLPYILKVQITDMVNVLSRMVPTYYRVFRAQADWSLTHTSYKDTDQSTIETSITTEQSTIEASITLDGVTLTDSLIR